MAFKPVMNLMFKGLSFLYLTPESITKTVNF